MKFIDALKKEWPKDTPLKNLKEWLQRYLEKLEKIEKEWWTEYTHFSSSQYHRQTIYQEEGKIEFVIISWLPGQSTSIHGHPIGGCLFQVLDGELQEDIYIDINNINNNNKNNVKKVRNVTKGEVHYIDNNIAFHAVTAKSQSVSFHIYSPPFSTSFSTK
jgi:predicted metal-dependent enzyme (double-stranded beta helix superfamily)